MESISIRNLRVIRINDFRLKMAGNIVSLGNLEKGEAAKRESDLTNAFNLGIDLAIMAVHAKQI